MSNKSLRPAASAISVAIAGSMMLAGAAGAAENPFGMTELNNGYMQVAAAEGKCGGNMPAKKKINGKCGTGKCGGKMKMQPKPMEGKCGGSMKMQSKPMEGKCGGNMKMQPKPMEGKCGGSMKMQSKPMEGKCGGSK